MSNSKEKISYVEAGQNSLNRIGEHIGEKALNVVLETIQKQYGRACIATGSAYKLYLKNSELRYNKVKTLADLSEPRLLEGADGIYVDGFVKYRNKKIAVTTVENLLRISNNLVIIGSGGIGKSMIMRHLFVNTHHRGEYIPVLVELRKIEEIENLDDGCALINLVHRCMESFDINLSLEQFEYSLRSGKYLFLFDGLDEVKEEIQGKVENLIQELSKKYPDNGYIISSRGEGVNFNELDTFTLLTACPLEKYQAIELVKKIGKNNEKTIEFAKKLENELFEKYKDFASNPLLLTMMYITFVDNNMIPEHLNDFYDNAYDALYKRHDANKEGLFNRIYKCKKLGEREFKDLFSYFCFQSYFLQQYEFSKEQICEYIDRGIKRLNLGALLNDPEMFFDDIKDIVCLILEEGNRFKFTHRSFQTYFAAYYTAMHLTDNQQEAFFKRELDERGIFINLEFYSMLYRLEGERFNCNIIEKGIEKIMKEVENSPSPKGTLLKFLYQNISVHGGTLYRGMNSANHMEVPYERNLLHLFENIYLGETKYDDSLKNKIISKLVRDNSTEIFEIEIDALLDLQPKELRNEILEMVYQYFGVGDLFEELSEWLKKQKEKKLLAELNNTKKEMLSML